VSIFVDSSYTYPEFLVRVPSRIHLGINFDSVLRDSDRDLFQKAFRKDKWETLRSLFTVSDGGKNTCASELFANDPMGMMRSLVGAEGISP